MPIVIMGVVVAIGGFAIYRMVKTKKEDHRYYENDGSTSEKAIDLDDPRNQ